MAGKTSHDSSFTYCILRQDLAASYLYNNTNCSLLEIKVYFSSLDVIIFSLRQQHVDYKSR